MILVPCIDGMLAPAVRVCSHLVDGTANEWIELPAMPGRECSDWACPACARRCRGSRRHMPAMCMNCARRMREAAETV
jgi:hypothetical protein